MATAPVKSQPLHNFSLPNLLRWGGGGSNGQHPRFRRSATANEPLAVAPDADESDPDSRPRRSGSRHSHRLAVHGKQPCQTPDLKEENQRINGKIIAKNDENDGEGAEEEAVQVKPWNLRPRRTNPSPKVGELNEPTQPPGEAQPAKSLRLRGCEDTSAGNSGGEKRRFWIALSKEEIEEDIFVMTGSRPSRRPKKRAKPVQKHLNVYICIWLPMPPVPVPAAPIHFPINIIALLILN